MQEIEKEIQYIPLTDEELADKVASERAALIAYLELNTTQKQCDNPKGQWSSDEDCKCSKGCCPYCRAYKAIQWLNNTLATDKQKLRALHISVVKESE
jgi:hypothetical protein